MSYLVYIFDKKHGFASFEKYTFSRAYEVLGIFFSGGIYSLNTVEH